MKRAALQTLYSVYKSKQVLDAIEHQIRLKLDYEIKENAINYSPNKYIEEAIKIIEK